MIHNKIIIAEDKKEAGRIAADIFEELIKAKPDCVLGLATGSTPLPLYAELVARSERGEIDFTKVRSVNLDEYVGLAPDHEQSYRYFMNDNLFDHIPIDKANTAVPDGLTDDVEAFCKKYEEHIESLGGIDLQLLGIGHDGHIGFNEPDDHFPVITHQTDLTEMTRRANTRFFSCYEEVPSSAITMGVGTVMSAKKIVMMITGADKHEIFEKSFFGPVTPEVPASILQMHQDVVVIVDKAAYNG